MRRRMAQSSDLRQLFTAELRLCGAGPGQTVAVLSEGDQLADYVEASLASARDLGARVVNVNIPSAMAPAASDSKTARV